MPRRRSTRRFMALAACLISASPAYAGEIAILDGKAPAIGMRGRIELGDEKVFHNLAGTLPNARAVLAGPGGSVAAALATRQEIRTRSLQTLVPAGASCASVCALIWPAGTTQMPGADARTGLHARAPPHAAADCSPRHMRPTRC